MDIINGADKTTAIILAAGQGKRMNTATHKQYLLLRDRPILFYSLKVFQDSRVDEIILVTGQGEAAYVRDKIVDAYGFSKVQKIVEGGKERYHSVYRGLEAVTPDKDAMGHYCFIHDGARPFVTMDMIERAYECVVRENACIVGMPVKDTIKVIDDNNFIVSTPRRSSLWMVQTPQVFSYPLLMTSYQKLMKQERELLKAGIQITDDACVVELFSQVMVKIVAGSYQNIKITTPEDLVAAESFLEKINPCIKLK